MDVEYVIKILPYFLKELPFTLNIIFICFIFGSLFAFLLTLIRIHKFPVLSFFFELYVSFIRCIPSVLLLFLVYYGIPYVSEKFFSFSIDHLEKIYFGIVSITLFNGGYMSKIMRASFSAVSEEQLELADSLGYSYWQKLFRVILPQAIPMALPDFGNALVNIMKDTSLFFTIGIVDLMGLADIKIANNYGIDQKEIYFAVALVYWLCSLILTGIIKLMEEKWEKQLLKKGISEAD